MKPVVIKIFGDKHTKPEPEHHRMEFPGGAICIDRTTDGDYWVHIMVNTNDMTNREPDFTHVGSKLGRVVGTRIDFNHSEYRRRISQGLAPIPDIDGMHKAQHLAVRIRPEEPV